MNTLGQLKLSLTELKSARTRLTNLLTLYKGTEEYESVHCHLIFNGP